jgi:hypothetical protein
VPRRYYLDTSIQIERNGGLKRREIAERLSHASHATSTQVEREWNRFVFEGAVELRNALARSENRQDIVSNMRRGYGRKPSRNWQFVEWVMGDESDLRVVEKRLADFLRIRARAMFRARIDTIRDGTVCGVIGRRPYQRSGDWRYDAMCTKKEEICRQPDFLSKNVDRTRAAAKALEGSAQAEHRKMGRTASAALADSAQNATKGKACHGAGGIGGDICIALECAQGEILLATDASFEHICPAIGVEYELI